MKIKKEQVNIIVSILTALIITLHIFFLTGITRDYVQKQVSNELQKTATDKAEQLQLSIDYGYNSINLISKIISTNLASSDSERINKMVKDYSYSSPFSVIEFVTRESKYPYFEDAMKGKSGIWINYDAENPEDSVMDFYTPLYYNSEIIGVLTGVIGGDKSLKTYLNASYYNKTIIGFLYDEDYRIISATHELMASGIKLTDYADDSFVSGVIKHTETSDKNAFSYFDNGKEGICCVTKLPYSNWHVGYVVIPKVYAQSLSFYKETVFGVFIFCTSVMLLYLFFQLYMNKRSRKEKEAELEKVISSLGTVYENIAILNFKTRKVVFYKMSHEVSGIYGTSRLTGDYDEITRKYVQEQVCLEDKKLYVEVATAKDLKKKLDEFKNFSFIYRVKRNDEVHYYQMQYFKSSNYSNEVVIAIKNVDKIMAKEIADKERLNSLIKTQASQLSILSSMASIYLTSHLIDLKKNSFEEFKSANEENAVISNESDASNKIIELMNSTIVPQYLETALAFTNLKTLAKRLKGKKIISEEMIEKTYGWILASFITVETDAEENPTKVLFLTQQIDAQKKREESLIKTANRDELTGLYNRHAFEEELRRLTADGIKDDLIYISMDVNGLKTVNDTLGHDAGDELLRGAADCMMNTFKKYGYVYRTGGDEFQALIYAEPSSLKDIRQDFELEVDAWTGKLVEELKISCGYVCRNEAMDSSITEMGKLADKQMYKAKAAYYSANGKNRRGQR